jgi:hypothetical protein
MQPGYLHETRGFPSLLHNRFGFSTILSQNNLSPTNINVNPYPEIISGSFHCPILSMQITMQKDKKCFSSRLPMGIKKHPHLICKFHALGQVTTPTSLQARYWG